MQRTLESYKTNDLMPVQLCFYDHTLSASITHWHPELEIMYVLEGDANVWIEQEAFAVKQDDLFLINPNDAHSIQSTNCRMLSLQFIPSRLPYFSTDYEPKFYLNSAKNPNATKYDYIKYMMAQFVKINESGEHIYKSLSIVYSLYSHLLENYQIPPAAIPNTSKKNRVRITQIAEYIENNYAKGLSLSEVADKFGYSAPYLSSFFEKNTGKTFLTFYNEIRLEHAVSMLLSSDESIETIAISNGFNDARSLVSLFKKKYQTLPSTYRKEHKIPDALSQYNSPELVNKRIQQGVHASLKAISYPHFMQYLNVYQQEGQPTSIGSNLRLLDGGTISFQTEGVELSHNYRKLTCVGNAKQFLYGEVQDMVRKVQKEIGFEYVKFHGILSDDMMVYSEDENGSPHFSFTLIDKMLDFLLSVSLRPLCQLSFMPIALASDPTRLVDSYHYNTSPPKDMGKWVALIEAFTNHVIERYGAKEVRSWPFCVWNEPDETVEEFSFPSREEFFAFYEATYKTVKGIDSQIPFGTPSLLLSITDEVGWARDFFLYVESHNCKPDFLNIHYYDNTLFDKDERSRTRGEGFSTENMGYSFPLTTDQYAFMKFINNIKILMKRYNMKSLPIYLTEWNLTISHRDLINDTCFKSCYLAKNLLENYDRLASFGYWSITDFIEELQLPNELYHGGLGLFTYNGIPKAHYNTFKFFGHLRDHLIGKGDGYFITKDHNKIAIILYNYEHYSKLFAAGARTEIDQADRYATFTMSDTAQFSVHFTEIDEKYTKCLIRERFINQNFGSSYDAWKKMGAQPLTREEDLEILKEQSNPGMYLHQNTIEGQELVFRTQMAPLEVRLIEIEFIKSSNP